MANELEFDLNGFEDELEASLQRGREAFKGKYKDALNALAGLSKAEIDAIMPGSTDLEKYDELITLVKEASRVNLEQAELKHQIIKLGDVAVTIARRVPALAALFV